MLRATFGKGDELMIWGVVRVLPHRYPERLFKWSAPSTVASFKQLQQ